MVWITNPRRMFPQAPPDDGGVQTQPPAAPPPGAPPPAPYQERPDGSTQILSPSAYKRIKEDAAKRGHKAATSEIMAKVREMGFETLEEAMAYAKMGKQGGSGGHPRNGGGRPDPAPTHAQPPANPGPAPTPPTRQERREDPKAQSRFEAEKARWQTRQASYQRSLEQEKKRRRVAERDADELRTQLELERIATSAGIKRTKFAVEMLREHVQTFGGDEEKIKAFDEKTWFEGLRTAEPWLFNEQVKPATTGTRPAGNGAPPPPAPGPTVRQNAGEPNNGFDARKAKPEDVQNQLQQLGISPMGP